MAQQRIRFNKSNIAGIELPKPGARSVVYDVDVPKLALRVTAAGTRTFYVVKRDGANIVWVKLGTFPDMTPEGARKSAERVLGDFAKGINPATAKRLERQKKTFGEAYQQYKDLHIVPDGVKTGDDIQAMWERCLGTMPDEPAKKHGRKRAKHPAGVDWTNRKLDAIDKPAVELLKAGIGKTHPTMANRVIELVKAIYNCATKYGFKGANPAASIEPFKEKKRDRFIQSGELPKFFEELAKDSSDDFKHFVLLSLLTGVRRGGVLAMRWRDIDLPGATWTIPDTKNGEPLRVPLVAEAVELLQGRRPADDAKDPSPFVFPANSKSGHATPPKKRWRSLLARAELPDLRIHDLRRSLGSWQAITGASLVIIGKSLGHKSPDSTMIYARLDQDAVRASLNTATAAMLQAGGMKTAAEVSPIKKKGNV